MLCVSELLDWGSGTCSLLSARGKSPFKFSQRTALHHLCLFYNYPYASSFHLHDFSSYFRPLFVNKSYRILIFVYIMLLKSYINSYCSFSLIMFFPCKECLFKPVQRISVLSWDPMCGKKKGMFGCLCVTIRWQRLRVQMLLKRSNVCKHSIQTAGILFNKFKWVTAELWRWELNFKWHLAYFVQQKKINKYEMESNINIDKKNKPSTKMCLCGSTLPYSSVITWY